MNFSAQSFSQIRKGKRDVTLELLSNLVTKYAGNPMYIFTGDGKLILDKAPDADRSTPLSASTDSIHTLGGDAFVNELKSENERLKKLMDYYFRQGELTINYTKLLEEQNKELLKELGSVKK